MAGARNQPDQAQFSTIIARIDNSLSKLAVAVACMMEERHEKATKEASVVQGVQQLLYSGQSNPVVSSDEVLTDRNQHGSGSAPTYEERGTVAQTEHVRSPTPPLQTTMYTPRILPTKYIKRVCRALAVSV